VMVNKSINKMNSYLHLNSNYWTQWRPLP